MRWLVNVFLEFSHLPFHVLDFAHDALDLVNIFLYLP